VASCFFFAMLTYPIGKLPPEDLAKLLHRYQSQDPRLIVGGAIGEDAAVIEMGDRYLVAKTDPITFATDQIGWYAVNVNANDIACTGATPRWFLATLLLPEYKTTPTLVEQIFQQISAACTELGITLAGGHTEISYGLDRPLVIGHMLGEVAPDKMITTAGARVGDHLILTKGIAVEATAIIAKEKRAELAAHFGNDYLNRCANFLYKPGISVVKDAAVAIAAGEVHALHDPTEGGVATGLYELAQAAGVGLEIRKDGLPYLSETVSLCNYFGLNPLGIIASGALLIAANPDTSASMIEQLQQAGIAAHLIGQIQPPERGCFLVGEDGQQPLPVFARDEITRLFE
jgi:hydrogenase maturation factor